MILLKMAQPDGSVRLRFFSMVWIDKLKFYALFDER